MIHDPNEPFDFKNITYISPKSVPGGSYYIRCFGPQQSPLYIQPPKCKSKNGILLSGKKMFCDLVFTHDDEAFLRWIENFETNCHSVLFKNRSEWFDSELEMHDIENSFASSFRLFKSQHVLRAYIPLRLGKPALKIYTEQEEDVSVDSVIENTPLMTVLEIHGIKCSSRSFQIEYEIKQMMILNPVDLFEKCVFSNATKKEAIVVSVHVPNETISEPVCDDLSKTEELHEKKSECQDEKRDDIQENSEVLGNNLDKTLEGTEDLLEVELFPPQEDEGIQLKKRNEVYFEMYSEAKRKAKMAREYALSAYLEAKRIKNTYLLDEVFESDDEDELEKETQELFNEFSALKT